SLGGGGVVRGGAGETSIGAGSVVFIAPGEQHCFINTGDQVLRFICLIPLQD
ncbi:MAG: cupin domain-containing protein, partial [Dehalococcoidia bacterium]